MEYTIWIETTEDTDALQIKEELENLILKSDSALLKDIYMNSITIEKDAE
tara:strand:- start:8354 stop:8503 length:150 start_codon:yes stop_codon:yes gene_type:complete